MKIRSREEIRATLDRISAENCEKIEKHLWRGAFFKVISATLLRIERETGMNMEGHVYNSADNKKRVLFLK